MTKDDIIRMAREAGLHLATDVNWMPIINLAYAEKFASLVAEREREACAKLLESRKTNANSLIDAVRDMEASAIRARTKT